MHAGTVTIDINPEPPVQHYTDIGHLGGTTQLRVSVTDGKVTGAGLSWVPRKAKGVEDTQGIALTATETRALYDALRNHYEGDGNADR